MAVAAWEWGAGAGFGLGVPAFFSAVRETSAPLIPGMAFTARSAAWRNGSNLSARSAGTVIEK